MLAVTSLDLISKALDVNAEQLALANEQFQAAGAHFVRNHSAAMIYDANHVAKVRAGTPEEIDTLLALVEQEFEGFGHRRFDVDFRTPQPFLARLALDGYEREDALVMLVEGSLSEKAKGHDIRPVNDDERWRDFAALKALDWQEYQEKRGRPLEPAVGEAMVMLARRKYPLVRYWLAWVEGQPAAYACSFPGSDGVGQVEDVFTHQRFRHQGLATALIHRCVADCREYGAGAVVIVADPADTPKRMYAAMGFRPIALTTHYFKKLEMRKE